MYNILIIYKLNIKENEGSKKKRLRITKPPSLINDNFS